ncbi:polysaccharide biosynthesis protein [Brevundimonas sp. UBA5936]|uniref:polysaccharide biosynthesis protein n=1 Tax=Brevundimonas sp. UBA5936 TaxID=1946133 RepID=UPI0025BFA7D0|nr:nucleoside-diphosphate sugar epimerase/dehydratase [Brevundimonas sp. UBA5936]
MAHRFKAPARYGATDATKFALHMCVLFIAFVAAYEIRRALPITWWMTNSDALRVLGWAGLYAAIGGGIELIAKTERSAWRFTSLNDLLAISRSLLAGMALFLLVIFVLDRGLQLPRSVLVLAFLFSLLGLAGLRVCWRLAHNPHILRQSLAGEVIRARSSPAAGKTPMLMVGDMRSADAHLRHFQADPASPYRPIGLITPNGGELGLHIHGVPVLGLIGEWRLPDPSSSEAKYAILFLDDPVQAWNVSPARIGEVRKAGHTLLRPRMFVDLSAANADPYALKEIPLEEFLPRTPIRLDSTRVQALIKGKRVLVTGAGGSIGSEICRQAAALGCAHLALLDHSEFGLFKIDQEIAGAHPHLSRREIICDVRDRARVAAHLAQEAPDIVFHAAALKHVPMVENHPIEGVLTNVVGTWNVAESAREARVPHMVMISTDKAVDPSNIMGATKRLAEAVVRGLHGRGGDTNFSVVRFGNVLGSAGSVAPIFQDQIRRGGPVTVTHPEVERYFMTIPEAVQLVLHATAESAVRPRTQPSVFVLDMGEPVKIVELARNMISLHGLKPDADIPVIFTGLRPGEKLTEELVDSSERILARLDSVIEVVDQGTSAVMSEDQVKALQALARGDDEAAVRLEVYEHVARLRGSVGSGFAGAGANFPQSETSGSGGGADD